MVLVTTSELTEFTIAAEAVGVALAARLPGSQDSRENKALVRYLRDQVARYFNALENRFPESRVFSYVRAEISKIGEESPAKELVSRWKTRLAKIVTPSISAGSDELVDKIAKAWAVSYVEGASQIEKAFGGLAEADIAEASITARLLDLPIPQAVTEWTNRYAAQLVTRMDDVTRRELASAIATAMRAEQRGVPVVAAAIQKKFADMSGYRANMIAHTEMGNAMSRGARDRAESLGSKSKEWYWPGGKDWGCGCPDNAGQGRIPINQSFASGHDAPLAHPLCHCSAAYFGATRASVRAGMSPAGRARWLGILALMPVTKMMADEPRKETS